MEDRVLITVSEAARRLDTYPNAINRWIAKGELEAFRVEGRGFRFVEGPLQGAGSPMAALLVEGRAMATAFNYSAREMERRTESFIRIAEQLAESGEVRASDENEPLRLDPKREADEG